MLDGRSVVYRSKVDPNAGAVKLSSTIGGRNPAHCTAVGKLLLSYQLPDAKAVTAWAEDGELFARTNRTKTVPIFLGSPSVPSGAISISALSYRTPLATLVDELPRISAIVEQRAQAAAS